MGCVMEDRVVSLINLSIVSAPLEEQLYYVMSVIEDCVYKGSVAV